jgi:hypothetical protein
MTHDTWLTAHRLGVVARNTEFGIRGLAIPLTFSVLSLHPKSNVQFTKCSIEAQHSLSGPLSLNNFHTDIILTTYDNDG